MNFMYPIEELLDYAAPTLQRFGAEQLWPFFVTISFQLRLAQ